VGETRERGAWLAFIASALAAIWFAPYLLHDLSMPLGPDVPVYVWWARLAEVQGIGAPGHRPGSTSVVLVLSQALHLPLLPLIGGLLIGAAIMVALAGGMLLRGAGLDPKTWLVGSLLIGLFARYLVWGFLANLLFAVLFIGAVAIAFRSKDRAPLPAAGMFAAAGLVHPFFFIFTMAILILAAVGESRRDQQARVSSPISASLRSMIGGGALASVGIAATYVGPQYGFELAPDAVLRHAGFSGILRAGHRQQMVVLARIDGAWLLVESFFAIVARLTGPVGRFLGSWAFLTVVGLPAALLWPAFAAHRLVFFAYFLPALAAVGLIRIARTLPEATGTALTVVVVGVAVFGAVHWWWRINPFFTSDQLAQATTAGALAAAHPVGTPIVVVVDLAGQETTLPIQAVNALRTAVPPDRIPDVFGYFGSVGDVLRGRPGASDEPFRSLQAATLTDIDAMDAEPLILVLTVFNDDPNALTPPLSRAGPGVFSSSAASLVEDPSDLPHPTSPLGVAGAAALVAAVLLLVGSGWARLWLGLDLAAWALAPAIGLAGIAVAGTAVAAVGIHIGAATATLILATIAVGGWVAVFRRSRADLEDRV
jgi:hypothetical protein